MADDKAIELKGQCHCGNICFSVQVDKALLVHECNCSICRMTGFLHLIVPAANFTLIRDTGLSEYRFNTGVARHTFCSKCGVKPFYVPRSNPDGFSVNLRCLDLPVGVKVRKEAFDGQNWEDNAAVLSHLA